MPPRRDLLLAAGLALLVVATFLPVVGFDLVYDDHLVLTDNGYLRTSGDLAALFDGRAARAGVVDAFRPTSVLFDVLTYRLFGLSAPAHHVASLLLAALASILGFAWLRARGEDPATAASATALFSVLAVHAEPVAVVSFREDLLALVLALAAGLAAERPGPLRALAGAILFYAACSAKMSAAPLALVLPAARLGAVGRPAPRRDALRVAAVLGLGLAAALAHRAWIGVPWAGQGSDGRLLAHTHGRAAALAAGFEAALAGLARIAVPLGLSPEHPDRPGTWTAAAPWLSATAFALALGWFLARLARGRLPRPAFVAGALVLAFVPVLEFVPLRNVEAERYLFVPSWIFALGAGAALARLAARLGARFGATAAWTPAFAYVVVQGAAAQAHARDYRSDTRLWEVAAARAPGSARAQALHALNRIAEIEALRADEEPVPPRLWAEARAGCRAAARLDRHEGLADLCAGRLAVARKDWAAAYRSFVRAVEKGVTRTDRALAAAAEVALDLGPDVRREAVAQLAQFVAARPYAAGAAAALGHVLHRLGRPDEALSALRRARRLAPERWDVVLWSLELALDLGDADAAEGLLRSTYEDPTMELPPRHRATLWRRIRLARTLGLATNDPRFPHGTVLP